MNESQRKSLENAVVETEQRIARLETELRDARRILEASKAGLIHVEGEKADILAPQIANAPAQTTSSKVKLFRSLFRGRDDVFPMRWTNARTGKSGYAPACTNEWVKGVCEKPRGKCGACPNQAFRAVDDRVILSHLLGQHVIGVYPLLASETCWFLAIDLDGPSWAEDVAALLVTCKNLGPHAAVERSRSGNGAHVWFFFSAPVSAATARRMGCFMITETMSRRHQLSMASYDRLFPNQDTMPRGGLGNLIALPFQDGPRQNGNTVFLDEQLAPYEDQWGYLASVPKMDPHEVERISIEAQRKGLVVGVSSATSDDDATWSRLPNRFTMRAPINQPLPRSLRVVFAQRLFIEAEGVPSALLNQIKRLAAFQNPEFFKRQNLRLSTALTPRVISCSEELDRHLALPRGCLPGLERLLRAYGVELVVEDKRVGGADLEFDFQGSLTPVQKKAARALLCHENGVLVAPPGSGKTVVGIFLAGRRARSTLVLVHRRPLLEQWVAQLAVFFGMSPNDIGQIGAGKNKPNGKLDVAMIQSLARRMKGDSLAAVYGHVIVDECHHVPAVSFERVMCEVKARFVTGLTATPQRRDGQHPIIEMQMGPIRHTVASHGHATDRFTRRLLVRETQFRLATAADPPPIQEVYRRLAEDEGRNCLIIDDIIAAVENDRSPIVLTERRDHVMLLNRELSKAVKNVIVLQGGMSEKQRRQLMDRLGSIHRDEERVILATGRFAGEGFDDPRLDTLFLALPVSWKGTLVQYAGRLHRHLPQKTEVQIYDYVDVGVPLLARMFQKRLKGYRAMGYSTESTAPYSMPKR